MPSLARRPPLAIVGLSLLLAATAYSSPAGRFSQNAAALGMHAEVVPGTAFQHVVFEQARRPSRTLHVYLDGDGTPWVAWRPATDPTPRNPPLLRLMALDPNPSVYLGRPCYHGLSETPPCSSALWTGERYSETVVSSMAAALRRVLQAGGFDRLIWVGYSGGGAIAVLLAPRFTETTDLVLDEGVLFRTNETAFAQTKRKLLDECDLWCIVSLLSQGRPEADPGGRPSGEAGHD